MKKFVWGLVIGIVLLLCIPILVMASGLFNIAASNDPWVIETRLAQWTLEKSVERRAPEMTNPYTEDSGAVAEGLEHFRALCVQCHGAPGVEMADFAKGLNPPAPALEEVLAEFTDGELFWITKHGIRMSGMPAFGAAHDENEIWKIVAFLKTLPRLTQEQRELLASSPQLTHGHEHSEEQAEVEQRPIETEEIDETTPETETNVLPTPSSATPETESVTEEIEGTEASEDHEHGESSSETSGT